MAALAVVKHLREPKVRHLGDAQVVKEDVCRLQVVVDNSAVGRRWWEHGSRPTCIECSSSGGGCGSGCRCIRRPVAVEKGERGENLLHDTMLFGNAANARSSTPWSHLNEDALGILLREATLLLEELIQIRSAAVLQHSDKEPVLDGESIKPAADAHGQGVVCDEQPLAGLRRPLTGQQCEDGASETGSPILAVHGEQNSLSFGEAAEEMGARRH